MWSWHLTHVFLNFYSILYNTTMYYVVSMITLFNYYGTAQYASWANLQGTPLQALWFNLFILMDTSDGKIIIPNCFLALKGQACPYAQACTCHWLTVCRVLALSLFSNAERQTLFLWASLAMRAPPVYLPKQASTASRNLNFNVIHVTKRLYTIVFLLS